MSEQRNEEAVAEEIRRLRRLISDYNRAYYDEDAPLVADAEYDAVMRRLRTLEAAYPEHGDAASPSRRVGGTAEGRGLRTVPHLYPMLSLQDAFEEETLLSFAAELRLEKADLLMTVEEKIDGLSLSLRYRDGRLELAVTRGDGIHSGEDVTANAAKLQGLPLSFSPALPSLVLRAEVYMPYENFLAVNRKQESEGLRLFANPRNCAAGSLRQLNSEVVAERGLRCFIFDVQHVEGVEFHSDLESLNYVRDLGFPVITGIFPCYRDEEILEAVREIARRRDGLPYGIDGSVLKADDLALRTRLGQTAKTPRWALAYKYPPEVKESRLLDIEIQLGRTGRMTPLAILEPILLAGTTVSRASLHNQAMIDALDLRIGDTVRVSKSGDIIPYVHNVVMEKRPPHTVAWQMPSRCPICGANAETVEESADLYCQGADCPAQLNAKLKYFASKAAMDIAGLGESSIEALRERGWLRSLADIYDLRERRQELIYEGLIGREKRVDQLLEAIERSKKNPLWRLLTGLGIRNVGPEAAKALTAEFDDLDQMMSAEGQRFQDIAGMGPVTAASLCSYFGQEQSRELIEHLRRAGVNFISETKSQSLSDKGLSGKSFVLTGTLAHLSRAEAAEKIEAAGGKVLSAVSGKTDYLIAGEATGSKLSKAKALGIAILNEDEFLRLLEG